MADRVILEAWLACLAMQIDESGERVEQLGYVQAFDPNAEDAETSGSLCQDSLIYTESCRQLKPLRDSVSGSGVRD